MTPSHVLRQAQQARIRLLARRLGLRHRRDVVAAQGAGRDAEPGQGHGHDQSGRLFQPDDGRAARRRRSPPWTTPSARRCSPKASRIAMADYGAIPLHFEMTTWAFKKDLGYVPRADQYSRLQRRSRSPRRSDASRLTAAVHRREAEPVPMLAFLFRRLGQSLLVVIAMATLVFVGVYALGNPIDILISPDADQLEREQAIRRLGLDQPVWLQFLIFVKSALHRRSRQVLRARRAGDRADPQPHAGDARAGLRRADAVDRIGIPLGLIAGPRAAIAARARHHDRLDPRLLAAELLARPDADPAVRGRAEMAAGGRARRDARAVRHPVVVPDARRPAPPDPAGADARDLQGLAGRAPRLCGHARGDAAGLRALRPRQGPVAARASSACTCSRTS